MNWSETIPVALLSITAVGSLFVMMEFVSRRRQTRYDESAKEVHLAALRAALEAQLYATNKKLLATPERWQELNHLLVESAKEVSENASQTKADGRPPIGRFIKSFGLTSNDFVIRRNLAFVLTPFHESQADTFRTIVNICNRVGFECHRGDEKFIQSGILRHIMKEIAAARVIIANIDGRNPNVFYELGICQALDKDVIIICSAEVQIPFDMRDQPIVIYQSMQQLQEGLTLALARLNSGLDITKVPAPGNLSSADYDADMVSLLRSLGEDFTGILSTELQNRFPHLNAILLRTLVQRAKALGLIVEESVDSVRGLTRLYLTDAGRATYLKLPQLP